MRFFTAIVCFLVLTCAFSHSQTGAQSAGSSEQANQLQNSSAGNTHAKIDPAKEAEIRKLMEVSGVQALTSQMMDRMTQSMKPLMANALPPGEYREKLIDLFFIKFRAKADTKLLADMAIPVYDKYFSLEELKGLIQFYQTPLGQKTISVLPRITAEMAEAGQQWGQQLGRECMQEVLSEHPDLASALEEAGKPKP